MRPRKPSGVLSVNSMPSFEHVCDTETLLGTLYKRKRYKWKTPTIDAIGRRGIGGFPLIKVEEVRLLEMGRIGNVDASSVVLAQFAVVEYSRGIRCPESGYGSSPLLRCSRIGYTGLKQFFRIQNFKSNGDLPFPLHVALFGQEI